MGRGEANPVWDNWVKNEFLTSMRAKGKLPQLAGEARRAFPARLPASKGVVTTPRPPPPTGIRASARHPSPRAPPPDRRAATNIACRDRKADQNYRTKEKIFVSEEQMLSQATVKVETMRQRMEAKRSARRELKQSIKALESALLDEAKANIRLERELAAMRGGESPAPAPAPADADADAKSVAGSVARSAAPPKSVAASVARITAPPKSVAGSVARSTAPPKSVAGSVAPSVHPADAIRDA